MTSKWRRLEPLLRRGKWNLVHLVDAVLESSLPHSEKLALLAIVSHCGKTNTKPSPGLRRLSALTSQKVDTTASAVDALELKGILRVDRRHRQAHVYDLSATMRGLLAVPPNGTDAVPKEGTGAVSRIGTAEHAPNSGGCPDAGGQAVPIGEKICPDPAYPRNQEGTKEGTRERASQSSAPLTLTSPTSTKREAKPGPKRRWTRVPADFQPTAEHRRLAAGSGVDFELELAKFRDHEFARPKREPGPTFSNWLRNARPQGGSTGPQRPRHGGPPVQQRDAASVAAVIARHHAGTAAE